MCDEEMTGTGVYARKKYAPQYLTFAEFTKSTELGFPWRFA